MRPHMRQRAACAVDPRDPGLVAGYNLKPFGDAVEDLSGNANTGTVECAAYEEDEFGGGLVLPDRDCYVEAVNSVSLSVVDKLSMSLWLRADQFNHASGGNNPRIIEKAGAYLTNASSSGDLRFYTYGLTPQFLEYDSIDTDYLYHTAFVLDVDNSFRGIYLDGVLVASDSPIGTLTQNSNPLRIGGSVIANRSWYGKIYYPKVFDSVKGQAWITQEYNRGKKAFFRTGYGVTDISGVTSGPLGDTPFRVLSGSFTVESATVAGRGVKRIRCVSAGRFYLPTGHYRLQAAYGDFNWHWSRGQAGNDTRLEFVSTDTSGTDGYALEMRSSGDMVLSRLAGGNLFVTDTDFVPGVIYNQRINRNYGGIFTSYTDGALTQVTAGSNPVTNNGVTDSLFVVGDFGPGDCLYLGDPKGNLAFVKRVLP